MNSQQVEVYLGIGSNVDSENNIKLSLSALDKRFGVLKRSAVYKSPALNGRGQDYLNLVVAFQSAMPLGELSKQLKSIEDMQGRERPTSKYDLDDAENIPSQKQDKSAQVTIDLDVLIYGDIQGAVGEITLPHRDILACSYVLKPLSELVPKLKHPIEKLTMEQLWQRLYSQKPSNLVEVELF